MICTRKLDSGVRVVFEKMEHYRSVALAVWVKAGSVYEKDSENGVSHFIEHMLFKGTKTRTAGQIAAEMDAVGGNLNAFTSKECTCFYVKTLDEHMPLAADMLSDILLNAKLDNDDIGREKGVVCEEILMTEDSPEDLAHETLCSLIYEGAPLQKTILGTEKTVRSLDREAILDYMGRRYRAEDIVISCAGNIDEDKLMAELNRRFASVASGGGEAREQSAFEWRGRRARSVNRDIEQYHVCLGLPGFAIDDDRRYALLVLNNAFGGAMSSRLFQKIREEKGLAYSIYSYPTSYAGTGYFSLYAGTGEKTAVNVVELILNEMRSLKMDGITKQEFDRAKDQMRCGYAMSQESTSARASAIGKSEALLGTVISDEELLKKLADVTVASVNDILPIVLNEEDMCASIVGRLGEASEKIEKLVK